MDPAALHYTRILPAGNAAPIALKPEPLWNGQATVSFSTAAPLEKRPVQELYSGSSSRLLEVYFTAQSAVVRG